MGNFASRNEEWNDEESIAQQPNPEETIQLNRDTDITPDSTPMTINDQRSVVRENTLRDIDGGSSSRSRESSSRADNSAKCEGIKSTSRVSRAENTISYRTDTFLPGTYLPGSLKRSMDEKRRIAMERATDIGRSSARMKKIDPKKLNALSPLLASAIRHAQRMDEEYFRNLETKHSSHKKDENCEQRNNKHSNKKPK